MFRHWLPAIGWAAVILALYATPGADFPELEGWNLLRIDKIAHFCIFTIFFVVMKVAMIKSGATSRVWLTTVLTGCVYGISLEVIQGAIFVGRFFEWSDLAANVLGVLVGDVIFRLIYGRLEAARP